MENKKRDNGNGCRWRIVFRILNHVIVFKFGFFSRVFGIEILLLSASLHTQKVVKEWKNICTIYCWAKYIVNIQIRTEFNWVVEFINKVYNGEKYGRNLRGEITNALLINRMILIYLIWSRKRAFYQLSKIMSMSANTMPCPIVYPWSVNQPKGLNVTTLETVSLTFGNKSSQST